MPKSIRRDRMAENFDVFDFKLSEAEMQQIVELDMGASLFFDHRDPLMVARLSAVHLDI